MKLTYFIIHYCLQQAYQADFMKHLKNKDYKIYVSKLLKYDWLMRREFFLWDVLSCHLKHVLKTCMKLNPNFTLPHAIT